MSQLPVLTVAYLANQFPAEVEPYVSEEIDELRRRGVRIIPGSVRTPEATELDSATAPSESKSLCLQPLRVTTLLRALGLAFRKCRLIQAVVMRVLLHGKESPKRRLKALFHAWLGACYAVQLRGRGVGHIHVHHGYFGSWIGMVAARLLGVGFSLTLHGSDLLVNAAYLDTKLEHCTFCITISEYNRRHILEHFPEIKPEKIVVARLGVDVPERAESPQKPTSAVRDTFMLLSVARLQAVKNHAFLVRACAELRDRGLDFECVIAGEGPERRRLESSIRQNLLHDHVTLLGHVPHEQMTELYRLADVVVLNSRSEGIALVLMEAMARSRIVVAPAITGIPELVIPGKTGFLYAPGDLEDFVARIVFLNELIREEYGLAVSRPDWIRHAARTQVLHNFERSKNLTRFGDRFLELVATATSYNNVQQEHWSPSNEDSLLQQI